MSILVMSQPHYSELFTYLSATSEVRAAVGFCRSGFHKGDERMILTSLDCPPSSQYTLQNEHVAQLRAEYAAQRVFAARDYGIFLFAQMDQDFFPTDTDASSIDQNQLRMLRLLSPNVRFLRLVFLSADCIFAAWTRSASVDWQPIHELHAGPILLQLHATRAGLLVA